MEILQRDPIDLDLSNSNIRSWLKEKEPQALKLVSYNLQILQTINDAHDAMVNHYNH
jgi:uncharacterized protein YdhG (YjbR/CyaY superfamily)